MKDIIGSIGELWKLGLVIFLIVFIAIYRKEIRIVLTKGKLKFKKGDAEVELDNRGVSNDIQKITIDETIVTDEKATNEDFKIEKVERNSEVSTVDMFSAYLKHDTVELRKAYEDSQIQELNNLKKLKNEAFYYFLSFRLGDTSAIQLLEDFSSKHQNINEVYISALRYIGLCYKLVNSFEEASKVFIKSSVESTKPKEKAEAIVNAAECILQFSHIESAIDLIISSKEKERDKDALFIYYSGLASLYETANDKELKAIALEKAIEYMPNNTTTMFDLAYAYANSKFFNDLVLLHYLNYTKFSNNNEGALNNLGVAYGELELRGLQIEAFKNSQKNDGTLAVSNMAYKYIDSGFYKEAEEILRQASEKPDVHVNVSKAILYLKEKKESEEERKKIILKEALLKQRFFNKYADTYFESRNNSITLCKIWGLNDSTLEIIQDGKKVEGLWKQNSLNYKFSGQIKNRAIKGTLLKDTYDFIKSKYELKEIGIVYIYINEKEDELNMLLFITNDNKHEFITFKKI